MYVRVYSSTVLFVPPIFSSLVHLHKMTTEPLSIDDPDVVASIQQNNRFALHADHRIKMAEVHSLPCTIHNCDGERFAVGVYFQPVEIPSPSGRTTITHEGEKDETGVTFDKEWAAQFRGRGLLGREWRLPSHVSGVLLSEAGGIGGRNVNEVRKKTMSIEASFDSMFEWGHDEDPSKRVVGGLATNSGKVQRALDWFELAEAVSYFILL